MANQDIINSWGLAGRALPGVSADNVYGPSRQSRYGERYVQALAGSKMHPLVDEGTYFCATNATPGTAIAGITAADGYDVTETLLYIHNGATSTKRIYMDFIHLTCAAAGTNGTNFSMALTTDSVARRSSGGTAITPVENSQTAALATVTDAVYFGAVVTAAATSGKLIWHGLLRTVIKVIGDQYTLNFGSSSPVGSGNILEGTAQAHVVRNVPPVVLGPGESLMLHEYAASQSVAAQYQFSAGWWER